MGTVLLAFLVAKKFQGVYNVLNQSFPDNPYGSGWPIIGE